MADASRSPLAPIEGLSFERCVGIGAVFGLLMAGLAWGLGPMKPHGAAGSADTIAMAGKNPGDATKTAEGDGGEGAGGQDDGAGGGGADDAGEQAAEGGGDGADDQAAGADDDDQDHAEAGEGAGEDAESVDEGDDPESVDEGDDPGADGSGGAEGDADDAGTTGSDEEPVIDEGDDQGEAAADPGKSESSAAGSSQPTSNPDAESSMTAEELYEEAKKALEEKRYRDAYRFATRSYYKQKSEKTLLVKGKAACGMKDEKAAKNAMKGFSLTDDRRKEIRNYCKDRGLRVGL